MNTHTFRFILVLMLGLALSQCSDHELLTVAELQTQAETVHHHIATVPVKEALAFLPPKTTSAAATSGTDAYVTPHLKQLSQEKITHTEALLTVIPATTIHKNHYSRILMLKVNHQVQSVVFSMISSPNQTHGTFSGELLITDLNGLFLTGYRVKEGQLISQFKAGDVLPKKAAKVPTTSGVSCSHHGECYEGSECIFCLQELDEVILEGGFGDSNGGGPGNFMDLNDFLGMGQGSGHDGPDMGMNWDYGEDGGGGSSSSNNNGDDSEKDEEDDDKIIIDDTFENNPCLMAIYENMDTATTFKDYLKNFDGDFSVAHLTFGYNENFSQTYDPQYWTALAITNPPQNYHIRIDFNGDTGLSSSIHGRSQLEIAVAFIHEMIHAEIFRKMLSAAQNGDLNTDIMTLEEQEDYINSLRNNFPGLYDYYVNRWRSDWGHQMMAQHYIEIIVSAISAFDNNEHSQAIYNSLAWIGLEGTIAWNNLTQEEKNNIDQTRNNFKQNETNVCD